MISPNGLKTEERIALELKALYRKYGFCEYRLSGFEDYSLYAENKSFQGSGGVPTFSLGGRLCALRPDVTLSIVKNVDVLVSDAVKKLFYDETVYRNARGGEFSELRQIGVEVIGCVDDVAQAEVCELILKTLAATEQSYVLDVSHAGILQKAIVGMGISDGAAKFAVECLERKDLHDFMRLDAPNGVYKDLFCELFTLKSDPAAAIAALSAYANKTDISGELNELSSVLAACGSCARVDFSIGGDADYYNGVVFKGYVAGVPHAVLSGGRYDKLLTRFGKSSSAVGFALYLGELVDYLDEQADAPDAVVVYNDITAKNAMEIAARMRSEGKNVLLARNAEGYNCKIIYAREDENA